MDIVRTPKDMHLLSRELKKKGFRIGFVPTMGGLHEGHLSLVDIAKEESDIVVMSIYLNPTQFNEKADLDSYPVSIEKDLELAKRRGVDVLFLPQSTDIYPEGFQTYVETTEIIKGLCGEKRQGHFRGVTTVVLKLFNMVRPTLAVFGMKDYQQLKTIEQMVRDLNLDIKIVGAPIIRESDGLAMSSRNSKLSPEERRAAASINKAIKLATGEIERGELDFNKVNQLVKSQIEATNIGKIDYVKVCNPETLQEMTAIERPLLLAVAAFFGPNRLIDNSIIS